MRTEEDEEHRMNFIIDTPSVLYILRVSLSLSLSLAFFTFLFLLLHTLSSPLSAFCEFCAAADMETESCFVILCTFSRESCFVFFP